MRKNRQKLPTERSPKASTGRGFKGAPAKASRTPVPSRTERAPIDFPPAWNWFMDDLLPQWVKDHYSPRESWKGKPFNPDDARFFWKGIEELSELFTEERPSSIPAYFNHPKFRSAYLLYFLPLQASKFITIFNLHKRPIEAALKHGRDTGTMKIADLGAGPGTSSIALLLQLLSPEFKGELPPIELHWFDLNRDIMLDGKALVEELANNFPKLRGKVTVHTHTVTWWKAAAVIPGEMSLIFMGHILNEAESRALGENPTAQKQWAELLARRNGGGLLMVEPANRRPSQHLSRLRNEFFEHGLIEAKSAAIWGPCLHAEACPLADGRDWCHFSVPVEIPGKFFRIFSKGFGSERQWVKFSYLWLSAMQFPNDEAAKQKMLRVISDPIREGTRATVLVCEPETPGRMPVRADTPIRRGDLIPRAGRDIKHRD